MEYMYIGKIVNTHGIKGEVRILSDFQYKNEVFKKDIKVYIGNEYNLEVINTYRKHKTFDMITLREIDNINQVLKYKGNLIYVNKDDFKLLVFDEDLIGIEVYTDKLIGKVTEIINNNKYKILKIDNKYLVPYIEQFIKKIDIKNNKIEINNIDGLINEN